MAARTLHVSDLHAGRHETPDLRAALTELVAETSVELVIATGDLAHRGRAGELARAAALLKRLDRPLLAVPGNHDIPYTFPARLTTPWRLFENEVGPTDPVYRSKHVIVCGLNSVRPWRHQGGRLSAARLTRATEVLGSGGPEPLRIVALHHHLASAPWRASRKFPLKHRDHVLSELADAGADLILGGHIHQGLVTTRSEFEALDRPSDSVVLATAPGLGRPRPHRSGEAQGAMVYEWDDQRLVVLSYALEGSRFAQIARREFRRRRAGVRSE